MRDRNIRPAISILIAKINCALRADRHAGIVSALNAVGNGPNAPGESVVFGNHNALLAAATAVRNIYGAICANHWVAMQTAALTGVNWHPRAIGEPPVVTAGTVSSHAGLGTVIDGMRISWSGSFTRQRISKWSTTDRLMVGAARRTATFVRNPGVT